MSIKTENTDSKNNEFIVQQMKAIKELNESEIFLDKKILSSKIKKTEIFELFDKGWLEKWKKIVCYEQLKDKLVNCKTDKDFNEKIPEVSEIFEKLNTKQKLEELGKMDCSNFIRTSKNKKFINIDGNFIPILSSQCAYLSHAIKNKFTINSEISNGIIFIHDQFPDKDKEKKLILLYKEEGKSNDFIRPVITLDPKENIKNVIKNLKNKKIEEILNQKEYKLDIIKPKEIDINKEEEEKKKKEEEERKKKEEEERKKKEEEEKKKKEDEDKKRKEEEKRKKDEADKKRREQEEEKRKKEEEEKKRKQQEEEKRKQEEDKKRKQEEEDKKRKQEEEKKKKEDEEKKQKEIVRKRKEEEEKRKQEEHEKKRKQQEEEKKKKEEDEKKRKEAEELKKKREDEEKKRKIEEEKKKKELEEEEKRQKEEEEKKKKEEEEKKKKEEEERKKKEEEEKKKKEEEERKKKEEEEEKKKKEEEEKRKKIEEEKIKKQKEELEKEKAQKDKEQKERERPVNKNFEILDAIKKQVSFDENIKNKEAIENENFLLSCSIINKQWYDEFLKLSNFDSFKENVAKSPNDAGQIFQNSINDKKIDINELTTFLQKKPENLKPQALDKIENLAFVDDEFAAKILNFGISNNSNNNNQVNNNVNQIPVQQQLPKAKIMMNKGAAVIQLNDNKQKIITANIQNSNLNKINNIQVLDFPKENKIDIFEQIAKNPKNGLIQNVRDEYISSMSSNNKKIDNSKPIINIHNQKKEETNEKKPEKPRITLDGQDSSLGLDNVGATCYMNATLQCLAHLKRITEHILNYREEGTIKDQKKYKLSEAYSEVVKEIWRPGDKKKKSYPPNRFKQVLGEMNSLFAKFEANDAKDLLIYFIEQMHTELNQSTETNLNLVMPDDMNPMDHQQVLECFVKEFMKKYNSVFSHYCYGSNVSVTLCNGCRVQKFSYQCFSFIIFPLLEAKKNCVLTGRLNPMYYNNYILNIEDCFQYNQKIELFTGNNQMYCNICQGSRDSSMQSRISAAPLVLILILNRGKGNLDFREPFIFWETIDIRNYVEFPQPDNKYFLCGVVSHMGDSGPSGHFIAYCRMSESQKWYCYNDSMVNESSFQEINQRGTPYILFYQKSQMVA